MAEASPAPTGTEPKPPAPVLTVRAMRLAVTSKGKRRSLVISFVVSRSGEAQVRLIRGRRVVATASHAVHLGPDRLRLRLPRRLAGGRYRVR